MRPILCAIDLLPATFGAGGQAGAKLPQSLTDCLQLSFVSSHLGPEHGAYQGQSAAVRAEHPAARMKNRRKRCQRASNLYSCWVSWHQHPLVHTALAAVQALRAAIVQAQPSQPKSSLLLSRQASQRLRSSGANTTKQISRSIRFDMSGCAERRALSAFEGTV